MNIYVGHSRDFNFVKELYEPMRKSNLNTNNNIVLPHEESDKPFNSKDFLRDCDLFIAEVSYKATGLGIELGWANLMEVPIVCIYKKGEKVSGSLKVITDTFIEYETPEDLCEKINGLIKV